MAMETFSTLGGSEEDADYNNNNNNNINIPGPSAASLRESSSTNTAPITKNATIVTIPTIDMTAHPPPILAEQMWNAARTIGFFTITNHGISDHDIDSIFDLSQTFFDQSPTIKHRVPFDRDRNSGYEYMTQAPASTKTCDQKESMQITAREGCMEGLWPEYPAEFRREVEGFMVKTHALACSILSLLEPYACPHLPPGTLVRSHNLWKEDGQCTLRLMHYPPVVNNDDDDDDNDDDDDDDADDDDNDDDNATPTPPPENLWRAGPHTDWGCITLLFQRLDQPGLECRADPHGDDYWIEVPPVSNGGITVNVGDMLQLWSGERLKSNMHRVRMPRKEEEEEEGRKKKKGRYSTAFFLQADGGARIEGGGGLEGGSITAGEYFAGRIRAHFSG